MRQADDFVFAALSLLAVAAAAAGWWRFDVPVRVMRFTSRLHEAVTGRGFDERRYAIFALVSLSVWGLFGLVMFVLSG